MKNKWIALILAVLILAAFSGCSNEPQYEDPLSFYYRLTELNYDASCTAVAAQTREGAGMGSLEEILRIYLEGPNDPGFQNPFPAGLQLLSATVEEDTLYLTLSDSLTDLSGLDLTIACCCLTMTCLELSDVEFVCIQAETKSLGGEKSITMNRECLLLLDDSNRTPGG